MHPRLHVCTSVRSHRCVHGDVVCACTPVCLRLPTAVSAEPGACQQVPGGAVQGVPWGDGSRSHPIPAHGAAPSGSPRPQGSPLGGAVGPQTGARIGTQTALGGLCCWGWHSSRHGAGDDGTRGPWGAPGGYGPMGWPWPCEPTNPEQRGLSGGQVPEPHGTPQHPQHSVPVPSPSPCLARSSQHSLQGPAGTLSFPHPTLLQLLPYGSPYEPYTEISPGLSRCSPLPAAVPGRSVPRGCISHLSRNCCRDSTFTARRPPLPCEELTARDDSSLDFNEPHVISLHICARPAVTTRGNPPGAAAGSTQRWGHGHNRGRVAHWGMGTHGHAGDVAAPGMGMYGCAGDTVLALGMRMGTRGCAGDTATPRTGATR